ncbi:glycoside hydrolase family 3 C-terminal domain-containing protein [Demequina sp. TTPB684]|uniref:glycoside hydrolase family 3 protein n=1 Tax=unclassified Demequina TaxID=2620311 RepID=UPI001CF21C3F|nr:MULTISPECIES: glycoside hydrolase family 3 N-terminal domain-containing protein [unclassified Demequina]MCB2412751.1 glycoside hydrolase family 3 C-terminal domain-containing protein [Demequina sp. TTPB684]UPU88872.1 glycoside hydrolase family 3 C-terminal domain-containing protein [Demequina sp. TMPB413]
MGTETGTAFYEAVENLRSGADLADIAAALYAQLTADERLALLDGDTPFWDGMAEMMSTGYNVTPYSMGRIDRLGIPGIQFADGPRGVVLGHSTAFPVPTARAATFDPQLEQSIGEAIGLEARAQGANYFGGVCINLPRHPAWGRSQESYGEEPALLGEMGAALARGTRPHVMPCVKHFALNSMENARFSVDVTIADADLHEYFLPHFKRAVQDGADSVMSAYNSVNGEWAGQSPALLTDVLRNQWGFDGFVLSDFLWGSRTAGLSLKAGLDVEAPFAQIRVRDLRDDLAKGIAADADVERAGLRILARELDLYARRSDTEPDPSVVVSDAHRALAREAATRSITLVRNEAVEGAPLLPLAPDATVAVVGRLADLPNTGDHGSSDVRAPGVVTAAEGLMAAMPGTRVDASGDLESSAALAAGSDIAVVVVGYTAADEGEFVGGDIFWRPELAALYPEPVGAAQQNAAEGMRGRPEDDSSMVGGQDAGGDRRSVRLLPSDVELIRAVVTANPRTVVAIVAGGTVIVDEWIDDVPAALFLWYPGMEGGHALADVLSGARDATGRLPFAVPTDESHLPDFDIDATAITYDGSFGQRRLDALGVAPRFPFGFGLGYVQARVLSATAARDGDLATVTVTVANDSALDTRHVVQLYARRDDGQQFLVGFASIPLEAGKRTTAEVVARLEYAGRWDAARRAVVPPEGRVDISVARHWGDPQAVTVSV